MLIPAPLQFTVATSAFGLERSKWPDWAGGMNDVPCIEPVLLFHAVAPSMSPIDSINCASLVVVMCTTCATSRTSVLFQLVPTFKRSDCKATSVKSPNWPLPVTIIRSSETALRWTVPAGSGKAQERPNPLAFASDGRASVDPCPPRIQ